ncbi:helix-turn-helix domain-containing protein [Actinomadura craniellae]|uniref:Helix-turn-helix domain-containing protein n=1 Tax=Actinomadura craniellae TaxID=2231787 RepID=A0A365HBT5_9ACTN|nr:helix-turn-helix domain-containing protein [Actinomadura craniellae]RAY16468.1 helix-turn-helix domain-containing protein [Actinomadura craniellae]
MYPQETVERALRLASQGVPDHENAYICGVSVSAIRKWRRGERRNPEHEDQRNKSTCPRCDSRELDAPRYAYLLGLYLGDGHIARTHRADVYRLEIACCDDWPGLMDMTEQAISAVMPGLKVGRRRSTGCTNVGAYSKHWPCVLPQHGPGKKHARKIEIVPWQQPIVNEHRAELVRGLIHSDGCRVTNRVRRPCKDGDRWYEYPRYFFTNASDDIRQIFTDSLDELGIAWKRSNARNISVARKDAVARLDGFVGPKY